MTESDIMHENPTAWVARLRGRSYCVYRSGLLVSTSDSAYALTPDGLSCAKARADYLHRAAKSKQGVQS